MLGLAFSRADCTAAEGGVVCKSTRNHILYIRIASIRRVGQSDVCPDWREIILRTAAARDNAPFAPRPQIWC